MVKKDACRDVGSWDMLPLATQKCWSREQGSREQGVAGSRRKEQEQEQEQEKEKEKEKTHSDIPETHWSP